MVKIAKKVAVRKVAKKVARPLSRSSKVAVEFRVKITHTEKGGKPSVTVLEGTLSAEEINQLISLIGAR
jgi:hypothetical protein